MLSGFSIPMYKYRSFSASVIPSKSPANGQVFSVAPRVLISLSVPPSSTTKSVCLPSCQTIPLGSDKAAIIVPSPPGQASIAKQPKVKAAKKPKEKRIVKKNFIIEDGLLHAWIAFLRRRELILQVFRIGHAF